MVRKINKDLFVKNKEILIKIGITVGVFIACLLGMLFLLDVAIMPVITRQGSETQVPAVIDLSLQAAEARLDEANLGVVNGSEEFDSKRPKGTVINQVPEGGAIVKKGRKVVLTLSKGSASAIVPDLEGFTLREARLQLEKEGLQPGNINWLEDENKPDGVVIGSLPPPGTVMKLNAEVQLVVNRIESEMMVRVPNFVGLDLGKAKALAEENYFLIGVINYSVNDRLLPETVMSQSAPQGQQVKKWTAVDLTLSETE
jgi:serine/threonine-protein kinase